VATERNVLVRLSMNENDYVRGAARATLATKNLLDSVDKTNDRTAWLAQGVLALAPAAVTMGAAAVPALVGLSSQMAVAAGAAGVAAIAFNGVGDGLKALNKYQLEPTQKNMADLKTELEKLGPAGTDFILYLDSLSGELRTVRDEARENMFPGVTEGIDALMERLPQVRRIIGEMATGIGQLTSEAGHALAGGDFDAYFQYLDDEARPLLEDLGRTWGNLIEGLANMFVAFAPMTRDFSKGFLQMSRDFSDWAAGLEDNRSFQEFLDYINENVPRVQELLGAITEAFVDLIQALAPIGERVVPLLELFFDSLSVFLDTPVAGAFLALAAAMSVYGRAAALAAITTGGMFRNFKDLPLITNTTRAIKMNAVPTWQQWGTSIYRVGQAYQYQDAQTRVALGSTGRFIRGLAPAAGAVAGMAFAFSDLDDQMGLTNTTMFGLMGLMAGPWGAAVGVAAGAAMDIAAANDEATDAIAKLNDVLEDSPTSLQMQSDALDDVNEKIQSFRDNVTGGGFKEAFAESLQHPMENIQNAWGKLLTGESPLERMTRDAQPLRDAVAQNEHAFQRLHLEMSNGDQIGYTQDLGELEALAKRAAPAMEQLGITAKELSEADGSTFRGYVRSIERYLRAQESVGGRARNVGRAIDRLDDEMLTASESADLLKEALDNLLIGQDAEAAFDAYKQSVRELGKELEKLGPGGKDSFKPGSKAAEENRQLTRDAARDIITMLGAQAKAGKGAKELAVLLRDAREEFIREGVAANISRKEMERRANALELTPKLIRTVFQQVGMEKAKEDMKELLKRYDLTPKQKSTILKQIDMGKSLRDIAELLDRYGLTPKQKQTILNAIDRATPTIKRVQMYLGDLKDKTVTIRVDRIYGQTAQVKGQHGRYTAGDEGMVMEQTHSQGLVKAYASGGIAQAPSIGAQQPQVRPYSGPNGILWSELGSGPWEAFISGHPAKRDRSRTIADDVVSRLGGQIQWFANGGLLEQRRGWGSSGPTALDFPDHVLSKLASHMAAIAPLYGQATFVGEQAYRQAEEKRRSRAHGGRS
jgi:hypothetical protein